MALPVQPGLPYTVLELKYTAGTIAKDLRSALQRAATLRAYMLAQPDADLITFGLTQAEIDAIKGAYISEINGLKTTFDAFSWTPRLWGVTVI